MMTLLLGLCLLVLLVEAQGRAADPRLVALLGVLVAINSALRFLETAIPGPGGFSPIFFDPPGGVRLTAGASAFSPAR